MRVYLFKTSLEFQQYIINKVHFNLSLLKLPMNSIKCKVRRYTTLILWIILSLSSYNCLQTFGIQEICKNKLRLYNFFVLCGKFRFFYRKQNRDIYQKKNAYIVTFLLILMLFYLTICTNKHVFVFQKSKTQK